MPSVTWGIYCFLCSIILSYNFLHIHFALICLLFSITRVTLQPTIVSLIGDPLAFYHLARNIGIISTYLSFGLSKGVLQSLNLNSSGEPQRAESFQLIIKQSLFLLILKVDHSIELAQDLNVRDYSFDADYTCTQPCALERLLNSFLSNIFRGKDLIYFNKLEDLFTFCK